MKLIVQNHKEFCHFEYESEPSTGYQLGDLVTNTDGEVGVVIQTFSDGDFRTDMFGMACDSEVRPSTSEDLKKSRPSIIDKAFIKLT